MDKPVADSAFETNAISSSKSEEPSTITTLNRDEPKMKVE